MTNPAVTTQKPVITGATTATVDGFVYGDGVVPAHIQSTQTSTNPILTSINVAYTSNITQGNLLVVASGISSSTATNSISDSLGHTWIEAANVLQASIPYRTYVHYAIANSSDACTVTLTASAANSLRLLIHEYSDVDTLDVTSTATAASGVADSGQKWTNYPGELIFGWGINNTGTTVADGGFTLRQTALSESTVDKFVTQRGSYNVTYPTDATANSCIMATFANPSAITDRGVVYNTTGSPTTSDNKVSSGTGVGSFTANISGLTDGTTYYVRAFATNSNGTAYGNEQVFRNMKASSGWFKA